MCFSQVNKKKTKEANRLLHHLLLSFKLGLTILASENFTEGENFRARENFRSGESFMEGENFNDR